MGGRFYTICGEGERAIFYDSSVLPEPNVKVLFSIRRLRRSTETRIIDPKGPLEAIPFLPNAV